MFRERVIGNLYQFKISEGKIVFRRQFSFITLDIFRFVWFLFFSLFSFFSVRSLSSLSLSALLPWWRFWYYWLIQHFCRCCYFHLFKTEDTEIFFKTLPFSFKVRRKCSFKLGITRIEEYYLEFMTYDMTKEVYCDRIELSSLNTS